MIKPSNDMEKKILDLTNELWKRCTGKGAAIVIGAGLNVIMTAAQAIPDKAVRAGIVDSFRSIADSLEQQNSGKRQ